MTLGSSVPSRIRWMEDLFTWSDEGIRVTGLSTHGSLSSLFQWPRRHNLQALMDSRHHILARIRVGGVPVSLHTVGKPWIVEIMKGVASWFQAGSS